jgi:hypothetical protein
MRRARFSIISSVRRHTVAGLIVKDLFRGFEFWLVDEGLESSLPDEAVWPLDSIRSRASP